ncbi:zinc finger protein ZAT1-like [Phoenix dactylifera]|uniref:Zinc finger protein ZAT1-like n=1 Tax=Phoenix dactylifera TaxID=42345 RepID=A0A8B7C9Z7_PHODC|nr:zinc finger protein ZAT1-like [Phoenix dactylifera]
MGSHRCKLCFRRFSSGRALGGHMRSHVTPRLTGAPPLPPSPSASSSSSSAADAAAEGLGYGLRENPRKSFRLVDPEFSSSFAAADGGCGGGGVSSVVQDRESETESSLPPALRRLSKRPLETAAAAAAEAEPLSSISDVSSEEDVARCLMLLSRDSWARSIAGEEAEDQQSGGWDEAREEDEDYDDEDGGDGDDGIRGSARSRRSGRRSGYQCRTCKRFFRSYQALGGHRASHKKVAGGGCVPAAGGQIGGKAFSEANADRNSSLHRCPTCSRVFSSAQALGGHKRSHLASSSSATAARSPPLPPPPLSANSSSTNLSGKGFIDLNQPAPLEEEVELSALSDATVLQSK